MEQIIIHIAIIAVFYVIGAYATTDILRLLKGSNLSINTPDCYCPICKNKIRLQDQLPIFAYIKNHGCCHYCKSKIPFGDLFLEIFLFVILSACTLLLSFNWLAYLLCLCIYELTKFFFILIHGLREDAPIRNLLLSILNNVFLFALLALLFLIAQIA